MTKSKSTGGIAVLDRPGIGEAPGAWEKAAERKPEAGNMVRYWEAGDKVDDPPRWVPAMLTQVLNDGASWCLLLFKRRGIVPVTAKLQTDAPKVGFWSWPPE